MGDYDKTLSLLLEALKALKYCSEELPFPENKRNQALFTYNRIKTALGI